MLTYLTYPLVELLDRELCQGMIWDIEVTIYSSHAHSYTLPSLQPWLQIISVIRPLAVRYAYTSYSASPAQVAMASHTCIMNIMNIVNMINIMNIRNMILPVPTSSVWYVTTVLAL